MWLVIERLVIEHEQRYLVMSSFNSASPGRMLVAVTFCALCGYAHTNEDYGVLAATRR